MRPLVQLVVAVALGAAAAGVWTFREPIAERVPFAAKFLLPGGATPQASGRPTGFAQPVETAKAATREMVSTLEAIGTAQANGIDAKLLQTLDKQLVHLADVGHGKHFQGLVVRIAAFNS